MTNIRTLQQQDITAYQTLWRQALSEHAEFFRTTLKDAGALDMPCDAENGAVTLGAYSAEALVGVLSLKRCTQEKLRHKALLCKMFISPAVAGQGIGKQLLAEMIACAKSQEGLQQLHLTVLSSNTKAQNLYAAAGFKQYANEPKSVQINGDYVDEWQMALLLT